MPADPDQRLRQLPVEFHFHGAGSQDFCDIDTLDLREVESECARDGVTAVPCMFIRRDQIEKLEALCQEFAELNAAGVLPHLHGLALEGPFLGSIGGTPPFGTWPATRDEITRILSCGPFALRYVVFSPDSPLFGNEPGSAEHLAELRWLVDLMLTNGISPSFGHFNRTDPTRTAWLIEQVIDWYTERSAVEDSLPVLLVDHLFNDMPLTFTHAWRTPEQLERRDAELAAQNISSWDLNNLDETIGPVPAALMRGAAAGHIVLNLNMDGGHVDLAVCKRVIELVGAEHVIAMTDRVDSPTMGGIELELRGHLWYTQDGLVAAGTSTVEDGIANMRASGIDQHAIDWLTRDAALRVLDQCAPAVQYDLGCLVLAAGTGTRLQPLTLDTPKPLMPVAARPLIDHVIDRLDSVNPEWVAANLHYRAGHMERHLEQRGADGEQTAMTRTEVELRGPAGSMHTWADIVRCTENVLVISGDCFHDIDLAEFYAAHLESAATLSVVLREVENPGRYGVAEIDDRNRIVSFAEKPDLAEDARALVSCGMYLVNRSLIDRIPSDRPYDFGAHLIPEMATEANPAFGYVTTAYWRDVGDARSLWESNVDALRLPVLAGRAFDGFDRLDNDLLVHPTARVAADAHIEGPVLIGAGASVGSNCKVIGPTVIGPGCVIALGARVERSVLLGGLHVGDGEQIVGCVQNISGSVAVENNEAPTRRRSA